MIRQVETSGGRKVVVKRLGLGCLTEKCRHFDDPEHHDGAVCKLPTGPPPGFEPRKVPVHKGCGGEIKASDTLFYHLPVNEPNERGFRGTRRVARRFCQRCGMEIKDADQEISGGTGI